MLHLQSLIDNANKVQCSFKHASFVKIGKECYPIKTNDFSKHAEMRALSLFLKKKNIHSINDKKLLRKIRKIEIYVIRITYKGIRNSKPCLHCLNVLKKLNIKKVHYSCDDGSIVTERPHLMNTLHISKGKKIFY